VAIARTVGQIVALVFFGLMVVVGRTDVVTAAVTVVISYLLASAMLFARGLGDVLLRGAEQRTPMRPILGFAAGVWAATLFTIGLAGQIDVILLGALRHDAVQIALYSVATLVFVKLGLLLGGWAGTATSSFADIHTRRGAVGSGRLLLVYVRLHILLALLVYPPIILLSDQITRYVFGAAYAAASGLMVVFGSYWILSSFMAAGIPLSFLLAIGRQRQAVAIRATTGVLNVVLDVLLIPPLGALGAIVATGTANVLAHISDFVFAARPVSVGFPWLFAIRVAAAGIVGAVPAVLLRPHDLIGSVVAAVLYVGLYCGTLTVLRPLNAADVELASRLGPRVASLVRRLARGAPTAE
jgi:O-antigen/teichoic acid export membrane protein